MAGFLDDNPSIEVAGYQVLGGGEQLQGLLERGIRWAVSTVGDGALRERLDRRLLDAGLTLAQAIDPSALRAKGVRIGDGTAIMPGTVIGPDTVIGRSCIVNTSASVDHDVRLGDYVHVAPGARLGGEVRVGSHVLIGMGAVVLKGRRIGDRARVGAGAVVLKDVSPDTTVVGVPARELRK